MNSESPQLPDSGDAWVTAADGTQYWGRYGAAGLLVIDPLKGVLLQHRAQWSHFGGTWGIPGGALHLHESPISAAIREAGEEAGVPAYAIEPTYTHLLDLGIWKYTTVLARVVRPFTPIVSDKESIGLRWVPFDEVDQYPLHPGFAKAWPTFKPLLPQPVTVVVDAANVMGAIPDGWWKDRLGAAARLRDKLNTLHTSGVTPLFAKITPDEAPGLNRVFPTWVQVTEGVARPLKSAGHILVVGAPDHGDDTIIHEAKRAKSLGNRVIVVTSDQELATRAETVGATPRSVKHLLRYFPR
jgi:8-oxo-dGTP diphosphatase